MLQTSAVLNSASIFSRMANEPAARDLSRSYFGSSPRAVPEVTAKKPGEEQMRGAGLGLTVVRTVGRDHDGDINLTDRPEGRWSISELRVTMSALGQKQTFEGA